MSWLDRAIRKGVHRGVERSLEEAFSTGGVIDNLIRERLGVDLPDDARMTEVQFLTAMAQRFVGAGVKTSSEAKAYAQSTLLVFLADEKIGFGDPAYAWDRHAARIVANEYEIDHWERVA